ncbi:protein of unknown function [Citrobacter freundii]|nr:protein of unknown function [Citrobacter freundii]
MTYGLASVSVVSSGQRERLRRSPWSGCGAGFRGENFTAKELVAPLIQRGKDGSTDSFVRTTHAMWRAHGRFPWLDDATALRFSAR